ncbi:MAG: hypothetical protein IJT41_02480 [Clostridia bacterium]|nr:hypothetical protein [Clostridia bacterium]
MKTRMISALAVLVLLISLCACRQNGYALIDVPKELHIDVAALSEDADNLMASGESTPLLAALPQEDLYIYASDPTIAQGVLVKYDGLLQYFPWRFTPQLAQPDLYVADYNGDGVKDIAFTFVSADSESKRCENLHVLTRGKRGFEDHFYSAKKAAVEASGKLSVGNPEQDKFIVYLGQTQQTFTMTGHGTYAGLYFDDWQEFTLGDTITVAIKPGLVFEGEGQPVYSALNYTASIEFVNGLLAQTGAQATLS